MRNALFFLALTLAASSVACSSPAHPSAPPPEPQPKPEPLPTPPLSPSTFGLTVISIDITGGNDGKECGTPGIEAPSTHYHADLGLHVLTRQISVCENGSPVPHQYTAYRDLSRFEMDELVTLQDAMRLENITTCEANAPIQIVTTWNGAGSISYPAEAAQSACEGPFQYTSAPYRALLGRLEGLIADGSITEQ